MDTKNLDNKSIMPNLKKSTVAVIGASGYGGLQTIRLLRDHPLFEITYLGGERSAGKYWNTIYPYLPLEKDLIIEIPDPKEVAKKAENVILSLPNGLASQLVPQLLKNNLRIIDLSADYRYRSLNLWKKVYISEADKYKRIDEDLCNEAVYGLPEWNRNKISNARLIASPGCFPTATLLQLLPFLNQGLIENEGIIIDAKTGTSGGGKSSKEHLLFSESSEGISPYAVIGHRHTSEIEQEVSNISGKPIKVQFTPHLLPMVRGILVTSYSRLRDPGLTAEDCTTVLETIYKDSPFVKVLPVGVYPSTKWTRYTNNAFLSVQVDKRTGRIVLMSAIDNLFKGQASQGIQSLNLMCNYPEEIGLPNQTIYP